MKFADEPGVGIGVHPTVLVAFELDGFPSRPSLPTDHRRTRDLPEPRRADYSGGAGGAERGGV